MGKTGLRSKACVVPVAVAASLGMAGMGLVSDGIVAADTTSVTDTLSVTVNETCTFKNTSDATFAGSALNGSEVENFNDSGIHTFYVFCNNNNGYTISATPHDLTATNTEDVISYTENYTHTGVDGMWTAEIATSESGVTVITPVPAEGGAILLSNTHSSDSMSFTATYDAYVGTRTPAGTYTGTIEYTLSSLSGTVNNGGGNSVDNNSGSGSGDTDQDNDNGGSDANSGNEVTDNTENNSGSGGSDLSDADSNTKSVIIISDDSNNMPSNAQNASPLALNNTYNTYSTTNTYNTANYSGSGSASTPAATNTQDVTSGDSSNGASSNKNDDNTGVSDSYENPLGVTTSTTSASDEKSGIDWAPIVVAGAALAVAGVAAVTMAQNKKEG